MVPIGRGRPEDYGCPSDRDGEPGGRHVHALSTDLSRARRAPTGQGLHDPPHQKRLRYGRGSQPPLDAASELPSGLRPRLRASAGNLPGPGDSYAPPDPAELTRLSFGSGHLTPESASRGSEPIRGGVSRDQMETRFHKAI